MVIRIKKAAAVSAGLLLILLGVVFLCFGLFGMRGGAGGSAAAASADPSKPMVALTYDDGPYTPVTGRILDSLKAVGGRATFFIVGSRINGREELVRRIDESGSEIGNHTFDHIMLTGTTCENALAQLRRTDEAIESVTGMRPRLIRPPCGCYTKELRDGLSRPFVLWTVDTQDWKHQDRDETVRIVLSEVRDGDIVLLHDLFEPTAAASEIFIPELAKRGFQLVTVSELMECRKKIRGISQKNA